MPLAATWPAASTRWPDPSTEFWLEFADDDLQILDGDGLIIAAEQFRSDFLGDTASLGLRLNGDVDGVDVQALPALEAGPDDLLSADAFILGTPENFGYMSGAMKYFLDRVYYPCEGKLAGRPWAMFVRAGNDGTGAIASIRRILTGLAVIPLGALPWPT